MCSPHEINFMTFVRKLFARMFLPEGFFSSENIFQNGPFAMKKKSSDWIKVLII